MKKITAVVVACMMILTLAVSASAFFEAEEAFGEVKFEIGKQTVAWNPDGTITDGEYYKVDIDPTWLSYAINDNNTDEDLAYAKSVTPELYMSWDENYVYSATRYEVTKGHENKWDDDPASMWYSGAVQFNYANFDEVASEYRLEYGVGLSSETGNILFTVWADGTGEGYQPTEEDAKVWLDGNTLTYETRCPWSAFADEDNTGYKEGNGFNTTFVWSIGAGQDYVHIQLAEGCTGNGKHAENMAQVTLAGPKEVAPAYTYPSSGTDGSIITGTVIGNAEGWGGNADAGAAAAFDGNPGSFFDPLGVGDGFCGIDAGTSYILDKVVILSREGWNDRFPGAMIQGSNDGENWTTLWTSDTTGTNPDYYTVTEFENNTGYSQFRYYNETNHGDVAEVEFYGTAGKALPAVDNYALGKTVTVTSTETDDFPGELAVDGDLSTRWASAYTDDEAITIDLGSPKAVNTVYLYWETAMATDYEIYGSLNADNLEETTLATVTGNAANDNVVTFDTTPAQFITIHSSKRATEWGNSLYEIVVTGEGDADVEVPAAESKGLADVNAAADGKNIITAYEFVSGTDSFGGEGPENLWDGETGTKFCTNVFPAESIVKLDGAYDITGFTMATANDNADYNGRSPNAWTISVSADGENWTELASGDDTFFEETNFTYYVGEGKAEGVSYVKFNAEGTASGTFQVSEVTMFGDKAADVSEELATKEEAPQTFDFGIVAAVAAVVSLAGFAIAKKH